MRRVAVVGGHGQIARLLHPLLVEAGHQPIALVRRADQVGPVEELGAEARRLDIESADEDQFAAVLGGCDAVVFAAGGGPDGSIERKRTVDLEGALKTIEGARRADVRRLVQISAIGVDASLPDDVEDVWRAYVEAKRDADAALRDSDLDWTVVRPGRLTDGSPTGRIAIGPDIERGEVTRADVAAVVLAVLESPATVRSQWNLVAGDVPISEAVAAVRPTHG